MTPASLNSKSFRPAEPSDLLRLLASLFAVTPLGILLMAVSARQR